LRDVILLLQAVATIGAEAAGLMLLELLRVYVAVVLALCS
jgi:hypothetical protein